MVMNPQAVLDQVFNGGVIAVMRGAFPPDIALEVCETLLEEGVSVFEMTTNSERPYEAMVAVKKSLGDAVAVGMGTVLSIDDAKKAIDNGADFVVSPAFQPDVVQYVLDQHVSMVPGVITPSEAVQAWSMGLKLLKLFPIGPLGLDYFKSFFSPLDHMNFTCNGGIDADNARELIQAGAKAVGVAGWLTGDGTWPASRLRSRARVLINAVETGRGGSETFEA